MAWPFSKKIVKTDEEIAKERAENLDKMFHASLRLQGLVEKHNSGWKEFCDLIDDYIHKCEERKRITRLDVADEKTLEQLKFLDHECYILTWVKNMPKQFINSVEEKRSKQ